ncbi:MAG: hypothetical protein HYT93_03860 [Parcubacteria group bacterium]|nr:hypothetical protein [Parcubacteria group bacterium]
MKIYVEFAPLHGVALVDVPGKTMTGGNPPCYGVTLESGVYEEYAPQMLNMRTDPNFERIEMDDEHPFPKVSEELNRRIAQLFADKS